jgi:hypothetical protein
MIPEDANTVTSDPVMMGTTSMRLEWRWNPISSWGSGASSGTRVLTVQKVMVSEPSVDTPDDARMNSAGGDSG